MRHREVDRATALDGTVEVKSPKQWPSSGGAMTFQRKLTELP